MMEEVKRKMHSWIGHNGHVPKVVGKCVKCGLVKRTNAGTITYTEINGTIHINVVPNCK